MAVASGAAPAQLLGCSAPRLQPSSLTCRQGQAGYVSGVQQRRQFQNPIFFFSQYRRQAAGLGLRAWRTDAYRLTDSRHSRRPRNNWSPTSCQCTPSSRVALLPIIRCPMRGRLRCSTSSQRYSSTPSDANMPLQHSSKHATAPFVPPTLP